MRKTIMISIIGILILLSGCSKEEPEIAKEIVCDCLSSMMFREFPTEQNITIIFPELNKTFYTNNKNNITITTNELNTECMAGNKITYEFNKTTQCTFIIPLKPIIRLTEVCYKETKQ